MNDNLSLLSLLSSGKSWERATISKIRPNLVYQNIYLKPFLANGQWKVQWVYRYPTRDVTKTETTDDTIQRLRDMAQKGEFRELNLWTSQAQHTLKISKRGVPQWFEQKLSTEQKSSTPQKHNKEKQYLIPWDRPFLYELQISSPGKGVKADGQRKYRQINKYIEILSHLIEGRNWQGGLKVMDMGSGLGYLTFALHDYLSRTFPKGIDIKGIELREELVNKCNAIVDQLSLDGLSFTSGNINQLQEKELDVLIALHACDTATDMAIAAGVRAGASLIILAPCCQKQVRKSMQVSEALKPLLKHGILLERQAELLTDGLRSLWLEAHGYKTKVFEFISQEHTSKNIMISAEKTQARPEAADEFRVLKERFGIQMHYLEQILPIPSF